MFHVERLGRVTARVPRGTSWRPPAGPTASPARSLGPAPGGRDPLGVSGGGWSGYLFLVDRVKDMIVTGGENVYSVEVENAIATFPGVAQVAVIGIPSEQWGEAVHAIVVPQEGVTLDEAAIIEHTRQAIAGYKVPKSVEFRSDPLPLSGAMKVLKRDLRQPYWEGHDRHVG